MKHAVLSMPSSIFLSIREGFNLTTVALIIISSCII